MRDSFTRNKWSIIVALLFYTFVFAVYSYPLITVFSTHVCGFEGSDSAQYLWNIYTFKNNLIHQQSLFHTDYICAPFNISLLMHTYTPFVSAFALLFKNPYLAVNVMTYLQFLLSAVGAYLLCKKMTQHFIWSLFTGFMFAFGTYKMSHYSEHLNLILTATIPFYILTFSNTFHFSPRLQLPVLHSVRSLLFSILLLTIAFFSDYIISYYTLIFSLVYLVFPFIKHVFLMLSMKMRWAVIGILFLVSHFVARELLYSGVNFNHAFLWQPNFLNFVVPPYFSALFDTRWYYETYNIPGASTEVQTFLGFFFCLVVLYTCYQYIKRKNKLEINDHPQFHFYLYTSILFLMMTIPVIVIQKTGIFFFPTSLVHFIPFVNNIRIPGRTVLMLSLFLPIVIAICWTHYKALFPKFLHAILPVLCLLFSFIELLPKPYEMINREKQQAVNEWLHQKPGNVMLTLPLFVLDGMESTGIVQKEQLIDQTVHEKKILGGYISRMDKKVFETYRADSICSSLFHLQKNPSAELPHVQKEHVVAFLRHFKPNLIHVPAAYKGTNVDSFIKANFSSHIIFKDSLNGDVVYGIGHL
jgi:hypothetical protein